MDKPAISYLVKEAVDSGIQDILIITAVGKESIEDYFDYSPVYDQHLAKKGQQQTAQACMKWLIWPIFIFCGKKRRADSDTRF